jgi:hypothetical protein
MADQPRPAGLIQRYREELQLRHYAQRTAGLIQSVSQAALPGLRAWAEVGGIAPSQCSKAFLPQPISI